MSINPGLERITSLLSFFPALAIPVVHIAGTNGKGSVSAILDSTLTVSGLATGRFNSPHLVSIEDSIRLRGRPVSRARYDKVRADVERVDKEHNTGASLFELLTVTALRIFETETDESAGGKGKLDVIIVECGMGGELDATNVFPSELVLACVLTSVDIDHQAFLGNTPAEIAKGKARIVKQGGLLVGGKQMHPEVLEVVSQVAGERGADLFWTEESFIGAAEEEVGSTSTKHPFSMHPFQPPPPQPTLTPLPNYPIKSRPSPAATQTSYNLLKSHINAHMSSLTPLLSSATTPPTSVLPLLISLSALSAHTTSFVSAPHPVILTELPLPGAHQRDNLAVALTVLHLLRTHPVPLGVLPRLAEVLKDDSVLQRGVRSVEWEGRCSWVAVGEGKHVLVDGAHNASSAGLLSEYIDSLPLPAGTPRTFILSLSHSPPKTPLDTLAPLLRKGDRVACVEFGTPIEGMPWVKPVPRGNLSEVARELVGSESEVWAGETGLEGALEWAGKEEGLTVVCGSLYLVADLFRLTKKRD